MRAAFHALYRSLQKLAEGAPLLFFLWDPHPFLSKYACSRCLHVSAAPSNRLSLARYELNRVSLPAFTSMDAYRLGLGDFPVDTVEKVFAKELSTYALAQIGRHAAAA
jgi:hypothetical protein